VPEINVHETRNLRGFRDVHSARESAPFDGPARGAPAVPPMRSRRLYMERLSSRESVSAENGLPEPQLEDVDGREDDDPHDRLRV
jgi:hypothetical protein